MYYFFLKFKNRFKLEEVLGLVVFFFINIGYKFIVVSLNDIMLEIKRMW